VCIDLQRPTACGTISQCPARTLALAHFRWGRNLGAPLPPARTHTLRRVQVSTRFGRGTPGAEHAVVASLDLKCYCLNALTDEGVRAVRSLTVLTSLELWGCSKVTEEGMRAVSRARGTTRPSRFEMNLLHNLQVRAEATVRCAGLQRAQVAPVNKCRAMTVARMNLPCCVTRHPEPCGVCPLGGTRHMTVGCDGGARARAGVLW
jgi:hypothetical protein